MSATLTNPQVGCSVQGDLASVSGANAGTNTVRDFAARTYTVGTGATQNVNRLYTADLTVDTGTANVLDVNALTDAAGAALNLAHVHTIKIQNLSGTAGQDLTIGGGTTPLSSNIAGVCYAGSVAGASGNGGVFLIDNPVGGFPVSNGTADKLTINVAAGTAVPFRISILGRDV
jgi:hypothetical protein